MEDHRGEETPGLFKPPRLRERIAAQYRENDKEVKKTAWRDKWPYVERLMQEAETAAEQNSLHYHQETTG